MDDNINSLDVLSNIDSTDFISSNELMVCDISGKEADTWIETTVADDLDVVVALNIKEYIKMTSPEDRQRLVEKIAVGMYNKFKDNHMSVDVISEDGTSTKKYKRID